MEPSDGDLVRLARTGDAQALGVLLARHRAAMHAVAVARLGSGPDVDDIVQDSSLVAIASLDRLRDPDLARSWLTGITRNLCREHVRRRTDTSLDVELTGHPTSGPEEAFDRLAVRDWVWEALEALSEPLRHAVILRYFSSARSYASIAAALDIPIGTVRSRLSEARLVLTAAIDELAHSAHANHDDVERERASLFAGITEQYNRGVDLELLRSTLSQDARLSAAGMSDVLVGREPIVHGLEADVEAGVHLRLLDVIAGASITVIEGAFENPADDPDHCPPLTTQVWTHHGDELMAVHLHYGTS